MIQLIEICIRSGGFLLSDASLQVQTGQYGVLMGRTGSGKTSILEAIAGLKRVTSGRIVLDGYDVTNARPALRGIGYVPQDGALFPTMSVREHLAFAPKIRREKPAAIGGRVAELAELLGIEHLLERSPVGLSGGERQRVALGRALSFRPSILLLDEPLSAVDEDTRNDMYDLLRRVQIETRVTALHVTHSKTEARLLAQALFVIRDGAIAKEDS
ncbi:MAG: ABC transporter ATP-binding protein [Planctomycetota bacterium]|jgi:ABC-type sugar transport system ATPase subunit